MATFIRVRTHHSHSFLRRRGAPLAEQRHLRNYLHQLDSPILSSYRLSHPQPSWQRSLQFDSAPGTGRGTLTIIVIVLVLFFFLWSPSLIRRCRNRQGAHSASVNVQLSRRMTRAELEEAIMRQIAEVNGTGAASSRTATTRPGIQMTAEDRREFISNVLTPKRVTVLPYDAPARPIEYDEVLFRVGSRGGGDTGGASGNDKDDHCCAICLTEYENGDKVCGSNNKYCSHVFHEECIAEWLMTHEECPCCRHYFLFFVEDESELEMIEGIRSSGNSRPSQETVEGSDEGSSGADREETPAADVRAHVEDSAPPDGGSHAARNNRDP